MAIVMHSDPTGPIQTRSPITAGSPQSCLLCCQPELMPGRLPAGSALFAEYKPCRLPETRQGASLRPRGCILGSVPLERGTGRALAPAST